MTRGGARKLERGPFRLLAECHAIIEGIILEKRGASDRIIDAQQRSFELGTVIYIYIYVNRN